MAVAGKTMSQLKYHYGLKFPIFPSDEQKLIIKKSINASRFVYNHVNATHQTLYDLRQIIGGFIDPYFAYRYQQRRWINYHRRNTDDFLAIDRLTSDTPALDMLVKWQLWGGWQNPEQRTKKNYRAKYGQTLSDFYLKPIANASKIKRNFNFLQDKMINSGVIGNAIRSYGAAWKLWAAARKAGRQNGTPRFKKKNHSGSGSYRVSNSYHTKEIPGMFNGDYCVVDNDHVKLPTLGLIRTTPKDQQGRILYSQSVIKSFLDSHQADVIRIGTITVRQNNVGQYFASFALASDTPFRQQLPKTGSEIGIDLNVENFLTTSDGQVVPNPHFYTNQERYLHRQQHDLSRKYRHAKADHAHLAKRKNYQAQRLIVAKKLKKITDHRHAFLDELSTQLIRQHDLIVLEQLKSKNLLKNHALAKRITDVGWRTFIQMLQYKADLYGRTVVLIDPKNTTQTCHHCGYICGSDYRHKKLKLADRHWICPNCGTYHIRDHNAAQNILSKGYQKLGVTDPTAEY